MGGYKRVVMSICSKCEFSNPEGMKFCGACGTALASHCPKCDFVSPPEFKFCGACGYSFEEQSSAAETPVAENKPTYSINKSTSAERRQLTVMFCDLADSSSLSDSLDPEEFSDIIKLYQSACAETVEEYDGYVAQYLGDGILIYFGYPRAHEDDPRRAVYSALGCIDAIAKLHKKLHARGIELNIRIGIHTGLVVTGEIGKGESREKLALGKTPNIAARIQNLASANSIFISDTTLSLVDGFFETKACGQHNLKGIAAPVDVYQVIKESSARGRIDAAMRLGGLLPIVGRDNEIGQLSHLWDKATNGDGQIVLLKGEGGVGKSRLMQAFIEQLNSSHHYLCANGMAFSETSTLRPVIEMLNSTFNFSAEDSSNEKFTKMESVLTKYKLDTEDQIPLCASLLNLPLSEDYAATDYSNEIKKKRTLEMVFELMQRLSQERPLLFVVEDLHWLDPSTLELLDMLVLQEQTHKIFIFLTCRPSFSIPWYSRSNLIQLNLTHLNNSDIASMVSRLTNGRELPKVLMDEIISKTDGVPLFVEELTKMVINSNMVEEVDGHFQLVGNFSKLRIPSTLQDLLTARLDGLDEAKEIAQIASVIGREFKFDMLLSISGIDVDLLEQYISQLIEAELISQRGVGRNAVYIFKHALIHDAAISSMLKSRCQDIHKNLAPLIEAEYPKIAQEQPEKIAHHYTEAGQAEQAVDWWLRAEQQALTQSANLEAISHFKHGMALMHLLPDNKENWLRELRLCVVVGAAYCATSGYASPEVEKVFERASELSKKIGDIPEKFQILWGLWAFYIVRADLNKARENAQAMLTAAEDKEKPLMQLEANAALGLTQYFIGDATKARGYMEATIALDNPERDRAFTYICGQDGSVVNLVYFALTLWMLGKSEEAEIKSKEAITLARHINHPHSIVYALNFSSWLYYMLRKPEQAEELANEVISLSIEQGFFWITLGSVIAGWSKACAGKFSEGLGMIKTGLANYRGAGAGLSQTLQLSIEADACLQAGELDRSIHCLQEAIAMAEQTGENFWLSDIYRLMGETLARLEDSKGAELSLIHAIDIAKKQEAPMLLLRAATGYARLASEKNKADALACLQQAIDSIEESSDTLDMQDAKKLFEKLSAVD